MLEEARVPVLVTQPRLAGRLPAHQAELVYLDEAQALAAGPEVVRPDPHGAGPDARVYKSGDLARRLPDGDLVYLGRIDHQVKIRGFRVELLEIEKVLARHPAVREAAVLAREDAPGEKRLVAYFTARPGSCLAAPELRGFFQEKLPDYMVPAAFVFVDGLPMTAHGKVNREVLPAPAAQGVDVHEILGDHNSLVIEPDVAELGRRPAKALGRAQAATTMAKCA
jgi:acyl-coenzyme A synthetase/AMP-(fatty) acid ligase